MSSGRLSAALARWGGRPTLLAVTVFNVLTGALLLPVIAPDNFGSDSGLYRRCALALPDGVGSCGSPYPPLMALASRPLALLSPTGAAIAMSLVGLGILLVGVILETRGRPAIDRILVAIAAVTFLPVVYELLLGQITFPIAAALYPVSRRSDAFRNGVGVGIVLALAPKAMLVPILGWMLLWRRKALSAAVVTGLVLTAVGILLLSPDAYLAWFSTVTRSGSSSLVGLLSSRNMGNLSLWPLDPVTLPVACVVGVVAFWIMLRDATRGFVASLLAGLLLAPYTLLYAYAIVLLAVKPALGFAPRTTRALALTTNIAHPVVSSILWTLAGLAACAPLASRLRQRLDVAPETRPVPTPRL